MNLRSFQTDFQVDWKSSRKEFIFLPDNHFKASWAILLKCFYSAFKPCPEDLFYDQAAILEWIHWTYIAHQQVLEKPDSDNINRDRLLWGDRVFMKAAEKISALDDNHLQGEIYKQIENGTNFLLKQLHPNMYNGKVNRHHFEALARILLLMVANNQNKPFSMDEEDYFTQNICLRALEEEEVFLNPEIKADKVLDHYKKPKTNTEENLKQLECFLEALEREKTTV